MQAWSLDNFLEILQAQSVTITSLVPSLIYEIVQAQMIAPQSLKSVFVGGSGLSQDLYSAAAKLGWPLLKTFGSSEACSQIFTQTSMTDPKQLALPHWQVKEGPDQRLQIKGLSLYKGYLILRQDKIKFAETPRDDGGYFTTEDMVSLEARELKLFLGRINDFVKINSSLVHLEALRQKFYQYCLRSNLDPMKVLLMPKDDLKSGLQLVAIVEGFGQDVSSKLKGWNSHAAAAERLRVIYFVDAIPRSELGKPLYTKILI